MSVIRDVRSGLCIGIATCSLCLSALPSCAVFGASAPSTVAQGRYYSSGEARFDQFFISLYWMQLAMAEAPRVPEGERLALARALMLPPGSDMAALALQLQDRAQQLGRAGVHLRLDRNPAQDKFAQSTVSLRSSALAKDDSSAALLAQVERSGTNLLRSIDETAQAEEDLGKLELQAAALTAGVDAGFADAHFGKADEVKKNLADARQLIPLMHARAAEVGRASEALLLELGNAVNTDDGSLGPASAPAGSEAAKVEDSGKKTLPKSHAKGKPSPASTPARPWPALESDAPAPLPKPSKSPPAPRDFEP